MKLVNIQELAALTGRDRETVRNKLKDMPFEKGKCNSSLYNSEIALPKVFGILEGESRTPQMAKMELDIAKTETERLRQETIRKERVPLADVVTVFGAAMDSVVAVLKQNRNEVLTEEKINHILTDLRKASENMTGEQTETPESEEV